MYAFLQGCIEPPFKVTFPANANDTSTTLVAQAYLPEDPGPYPERARKTNSVRFTNVQVWPSTPRTLPLLEPTA